MSVYTFVKSTTTFPTTPAGNQYWIFSLCSTLIHAVLCICERVTKRTKGNVADDKARRVKKRQDRTRQDKTTVLQTGYSRSIRVSKDIKEFSVISAA